MGTLKFTQNLKFPLFILLSIFIFSCSQEEIEPEEPFEANLSVTGKDIIKDQYIVLLSKRSGKDDPRAEAALEALSKEVGSMNGARVKGKFRHSVTGFVAKLDEKQVEKLKNHPKVFSITADSYLELESFNDDLIVYEYPHWGLDRIDQRGERMDRAYVYNSTGNGVTAYVMDSGLRITHEEFEGRASIGVDMEFLIDPENLDPDQQPGYDCLGHGTPVAGLIGGKNYGVAKDVKLISVKVSPKCENRTPLSYLIGGVDWITSHALENDNLPAVVNMSLGSLYHSDFDPLEVAINNAIEVGLNFTVSAGNGNMDACEITPAKISGAITVGASDLGNFRTWFSNYGECLDLYAPGLNVISAANKDDVGHEFFGGTSASAPMTAGVVALYLENNPEATPVQVHNSIMDNATADFIKEVPSGTASFVHSLWEPVDFTPPPAPTIEIKGYLSKVRNRHAISVQWTTPEEPQHTVYRDGIPVAKFDNNESSYLEYTEEKNATFIYKVCGVNYDNCSEELRVVIGKGGELTTPTNSPPISYFYYTTNWLKVQFNDQSEDGDGSIVGWLWDFGDGNSSTLQNPAHTYTSAGGYRVYLTVTDNAGATAVSQRDVYVYSQEPQPSQLDLSVFGRKEKGQWVGNLQWDPANISSIIEIYRNGTLIETVSNEGSYMDYTGFKGSGSMVYQICEAGTTTCSNEVTVQF